MAEEPHMPTGLIEDPRFILYGQVQRILELRSRSEGAAEAIIGLQALLAPFKDQDKEYAAKAQEIAGAIAAGQDFDTIFWEWFESAIKLMARLRLWVIPGREPKFGEELLQSV